LRRALLALNDAIHEREEAHLVLDCAMRTATPRQSNTERDEGT
jgi:hypothetical protein